MSALSFSTEGVGHSGHLSEDILRNQHDPPSVVSGKGLSPSAKYLFDLNGFLVLRNVIDKDMIKQANDAIDKYTDDGALHERAGVLRTSALYGRESGALKGDGSTGRKDMGGMLRWEKPYCEPFREILGTYTLFLSLSLCLYLSLYLSILLIS